MDLKHLSESLAVRESNLPNSSFERVSMVTSSFERVTMARTWFEEADLSELHISRWNLTEVSSSECKPEKMTIDGVGVGVGVADVFAAHSRSKQ